MATVEDKIDETNRLLGQLVRGGGGFGGSSGGSGGVLGSLGGSGLSKSFGLVSEAASGLLGGFNSLLRGTMNSTQALDMMSSSISKIPLIGGAMGDTLKVAGQAMIDTNSVMKETGKYGANFNSNVGDFSEKIAGVGLTQQQYANIVKENSTALNGLGSTVNTSQQNFLLFSQKLRESDVVRQLQAMGLSAEEVAAVGAASMANQTRIDMSTATAQRKAIDNAIDLAAAMEENTRITGISRQQQVDSLQKATADARVHATLRGLDADAQARYAKMHTSLETLGPGMQKFADEIFTTGIRTKEGQAMLSSLGTAGVEMEKAVKLVKTAKTEEAKIAAEAQLQRAQNAVNERMSSQDFINIVKYNTDGVGDAARTLEEGNKSLGPALAGQAEAIEKHTDTSLDAVAKAQQKTVGKEMIGIDPKTNKPFEENAIKLGQTINMVDRTIADHAAGFAKSLHDSIESTKTFGTALDKLSDKILKPQTQEQASQNQKNMFNDVKNAVSSILPTVTTTSTQTADQATKPVVEKYPKFANGTPGMRDFLSGGGAFDKIFEHFKPEGEMVELHGEEVVANKEQMMTFKSQITSHIGDLLNAKNKNQSSSPVEMVAEQFKSAVEQIPQPTFEPENAIDFSKITEKFNNLVTKIEPSMTEQFGDIAKNIKMPDLETTFNNIGNDFKSTFDSFEVPDLGSMFNDISDSFSDVADEFELPDLKDMFTGIGDDFTSITDNFELPDLGNVFDDLGKNFTDLTKNFELPNIDTLFDSAKSPLSDMDKFVEDMHKHMNPEDKAASEKATLALQKLEAKTQEKKNIAPTLAEIRPPQPENKVNTITSKLKEEQKPVQPAPAPVPPPPVQQQQTQQQNVNVQKPEINNQTLTDVITQLELMNKTLAQIAAHSNETVNLTNKQIRATKGLSGNRFA